MKIVHWIILLLLALLGYTAYEGFIVADKVELDEAEIILKANAGQGTLEPQGKHKCGATDKPGCVQFDKQTLGTITFRIQNGKKDETCKANPMPQWVITEVELSADELDPGSGKGDYSKPIPAWLASAFPQVNAASGIVYEAGLDFGTSSAVIIDLNNHIGEKVLYYKVTAQNCSGTTMLVTDPSIRNKGK